MLLAHARTQIAERLLLDNRSNKKLLFLKPIADVDARMSHENFMIFQSELHEKTAPRAANPMIVGCQLGRVGLFDQTIDIYHSSSPE